MIFRQIPTNAYLVDFEEYGNFILVPHSNELWEIHTNLSRESFGASKEFGDAMLKFVWENTGVQKLFTKIPKVNKLAKRLAIRCGLSFEGVIKESYLYDGVLIDQDIYSIGRTSCQQ